jgi:hypothetical protein
MMGLIPALRALFQKSKAPKTKPWSVVAREDIPSSWQASKRSSRRAAPSSIEYSVCTWRWVKLFLPVAVVTRPV